MLLYFINMDKVSLFDKISNVAFSTNLAGLLYVSASNIFIQIFQEKMCLAAMFLNLFLMFQ